MYSRKTEKQRGRLETREYYYTEEIDNFTDAAKNAGARLNKYEWSATDSWERDNDWVLRHYLPYCNAPKLYRDAPLPAFITYRHLVAGKNDLQISQACTSLRPELRLYVTTCLCLLTCECMDRIYDVCRTSNYLVVNAVSLYPYNRLLQRLSESI